MQYRDHPGLSQLRCRCLKWAMPPCSHTLTSFLVKSRRGVQLLLAQCPAFYFMFSLPKQPLHHAPQDSCLPALTVCLPRLGSNQGVQLFLVPTKPFCFLGQELCLFTSAGMKVEEVWLRECSPGCFLGTCYA